MNAHFGPLWNIHVTIQPPGFGSPLCLAVDVEPKQFQLGPLPRGREIDFRDAGVAMKMKRDRDACAKQISEQMATILASAILNCLEQQDDIHGHDRKQWEEMTKHGDTLSPRREEQ